MDQSIWTDAPEWAYRDLWTPSGFLQYQLQGADILNVALFNKATELKQPRSSAVLIRHCNLDLSHLVNNQNVNSVNNQANSQGAANAAGNAAGGASGGANINLGGTTFVQLQALIAAIQGGGKELEMPQQHLS